MQASNTEYILFFFFTIQYQIFIASNMCIWVCCYIDHIKKMTNIQRKTKIGIQLFSIWKTKHIYQSFSLSIASNIELLYDRLSIIQQLQC